MPAAGPPEDIIWGTVSEMRADGQRVPYPLGLRGRSIEAQVHFVLAPIEWLRALEVVAEHLEVEGRHCPRNGGLCPALGDASSLLILLDEHHTSICLVRGGQLQWSTLVPVGERGDDRRHGRGARVARAPGRRP